MDYAYAARLSAAEPEGGRPLAELVRRLGAAGLRRATASGDAVEAAAAGLVATGLADDSRAIRRGSLFVAIPGQHVDGHDFVQEARANFSAK